MKQIILKLDADVYKDYQAICKEAGDDLKATLIEYIQTRINEANRKNIGFHFKRKKK